MATLKYWLWLTTRRGFRPADCLGLLEHFGSPEAVYFADPAEYELLIGNSVKLASLADKSMAGAEAIQSDCARLGVDILTLQDARYPERLRQIFDPPCVLYVKGRLPAMDEEVAIGVVGARSATPYGTGLAGRLGLELSRSGAVVVSGIAQGIDSAALRGALRGGGTPVSVLGNGVDVYFPSENKYLYHDVAAAGALVSEFPPGSEPLGWHFPMRNRILSGLSLGVVAVEAAAERSGTLVTARLALEQNRDVFAFPGPADAPMSGGTNRLIQRGEAKLILSARDVLCEYESLYPGRLTRPDYLPEQAVQARLSAPQADPAPAPEPAAELEPELDKGAERAYITLAECRERFTDDERDILLALEEGPLRPDDLVERTQIPARRVFSALTLLQVQGAVTEAPGKRFSALLLIDTQAGKTPSHI